MPYTDDEDFLEMLSLASEDIPSEIPEDSEEPQDDVA